MSRIRSIHPGQWTDEEFVSCTPFARLLAIAIRCEADDNGIFEWKPIGLKMRLFPMDQVDVGELLQELIKTRQIQNFEHEGRSYGAIRNFRRFQNPRTPKVRYPLPIEIASYVGTSACGAPDQDADPPKRGRGRPRKTRTDENACADGNDFPQNAEKRPQMEQEREKEKVEEQPSAASVREVALQVKSRGSMKGEPTDEHVVVAWLRDGIDPNRCIYPAIERVGSRQRDRGSPVATFAYFDGAVRDAFEPLRRADEKQAAQYRRILENPDYKMGQEARERYEAELAEKRRAAGEAGRD